MLNMNDVTEYRRLFIERAESIDGLCWICRKKPAVTGEHVLPRKAIDRFFNYCGDPRKLYLNAREKRNQILQSPKSAHLHADTKICASCNGSLTNESDSYFSRLIEYLKYEHPNRLRLKFNRVYRRDQKKGAFLLHMYFQKFMGFRIREIEGSNGPISFSESLLARTASPFLFFGFNKVSDIKGFWQGPTVKSAISMNFPLAEMRGLPVYLCPIRLDIWEIEVYVAPFKSEGYSGIQDMYHPDNHLLYMRIRDRT